MELLERPVDSRFRDAVGVMMARSKTIGKPYSVDYAQLAKMVDYPGDLSRSDIESVMNNNPDMASSLSDFDEHGIEVNANGDSTGGMDLPGADRPLDMGADMGMDAGADMGADIGAEMTPDAGLGATPEPAMGVEPAIGEPTDISAPTGPNLLKQAAARAAKRRSL